MSSEALRLADALDKMRGPHLGDGINPGVHAYQLAALLRTQAARIAELEKAHQRQVYETSRILALLDAANERGDQLRAEVERLRKPLTDEQIKAACSDIYLSDYPQGSSSYDVALARAIEAAKEAK